MNKGIFWFIFVIIVGALLGSFLGKFIGMVLPYGTVKDLFLTDITAGLSPAKLDLSIVELTLGCLFKINVMAVIGIIAAAVIFRKISK